MRRNILYGPRIVGDIAPGQEPSRLDGAGVKAWSRMDFPGLRIAGQSDQLVTTKSATQKFQIGTRRIEYGRTFRYSKAGAALTYTGLQRLLANGNFTPEDPAHEDEFGFYGDLYTAASIGDKYVDLEIATAYAANYFQGGYVTFFSDSNRGWYYVVKSDLGNGTYCRIYLDHPLTVAHGATLGLEVYRSPYSNIREGAVAAQFCSFVGIAYCGAVDSGDYFWLQTRGPAWITPIDWSTNLPGYTAEKRDVYAHQDGTVRLQDTTGSRQRVGYLLSATASTYGDVFVMLQLE